MCRVSNTLLFNHVECGTDTALYEPPLAGLIFSPLGSNPREEVLAEGWGRVAFGEGIRASLRIREDADSKERLVQHEFPAPDTDCGRQ